MQENIVISDAVSTIDDFIEVHGEYATKEAWQTLKTAVLAQLSHNSIKAAICPSCGNVADAFQDPVIYRYWRDLNLLSFNITRAVASVAVCALGGWCMYLTKGNTGIGWAIFGLFLIWATSFSSGRSKSDANKERRKTAANI